MRAHVRALAPLVVIAACIVCPTGRVRAQAAELKVVDPLTEIRRADDLDAAPGAKVLRLVGPRNGVCSGQVVATGPGLADLRAEMGELRSAGGVIPVGAVQVRYAVMSAVRFPLKKRVWIGGDLGAKYNNMSYFDALHVTPPVGARILPVWVTVNIPRDAAPGRYAGMLTVGGAKVPVELEVGRWRAPDPKDFTTWVGFVQSPDTLAATYKVPMWSDEHFALIGKSFEYLGRIGNRPLFVTVVNKTHLGNEFAMVRWRRDADGRLTPDLSVVERYLDLYREHAGRPRPLILYVWETQLSGRKPAPRRDMPVTAVDADGKVSEVTVPPHGAPGADERMWKSLMDAMRAAVRARGWDDSTIVLGGPCDQRPEARTVDLFKRISPYARWCIYTHGRGDPLPQDGKVTADGMAIALYEHPYRPFMLYSMLMETGIQGGWNLGLDFARVCNPRQYLFEYSPLSQFRSFADGTCATWICDGHLYRGHCGQGFSRLGIDAWELEHIRSLLVYRYRRGNMPLMYRAGPRALLAPGPDGPLGTARFEMLREGIQECEARITIEKALVANSLPGPLAEECRGLLLERIRARLKDGRVEVRWPKDPARPPEPTDVLWGLPPDWQDSTARLFELAGRAAEGQR